MRVIPERARRMIRWHVVLILKAYARIYGDQNVIAVSGRIHPQSMRVQISAVEAVWRVDATAGGYATRIARQLVVERNADGVARVDIQHRRNKGDSGIDVRALIAAKFYLVETLYRRVPDRTSGVDDVEVERCLAGCCLRAGRRSK